MRLTTTLHPSTTCEGAQFKLFPKTYGRKMELDRRIAEYNQSQRSLFNKRAQLLEEARTKASEILGLNRSEAILKVDASGTPDRQDPQDTPKFQAEMLRQLDQEQTYQLGDKIESNKLAHLRPIYMAVYLYQVQGIETEDGTPVDYRENMSQLDKDRFYQEAPADLIDEIFEVLSDRIAMTEAERANFGLPTTGGAAVAGSTPSTTAPNANAGGSGAAVSAA